MQIEYSKKAAKYISGLDRSAKKRIETAIDGLTENPPTGYITLMQVFSDGRKRLRVGKYRIVYNHFQDEYIAILHIINVDSRGGIYK